MRGVVTGASGGIGAAWPASGPARARVVLVGRGEELAKIVAELNASGSNAAEFPGASYCRSGRSRFRRRRYLRFARRSAALRRCVERFGGLDFLVNNAGIGALGRFADADADRLRRIMEVNFFAPAELIREALPELERGRRPIVVNVGSILAHPAIPHAAEYCASKFALRGLSESLRAERGRVASTC